MTLRLVNYLMTTKLQWSVATCRMTIHKLCQITPFSLTTLILGLNFLRRKLTFEQLFDPKYNNLGNDYPFTLIAKDLLTLLKEQIYMMFIVRPVMMETFLVIGCLSLVSVTHMYLPISIKK